MRYTRYAADEIRRPNVFLPNGVKTFAAFQRKPKKGDFYMKAKIVKLLRLTGIDVLVLGFIEKLALALIKKCTAWHTYARNYLDQVEENGNE